MRDGLAESLPTNPARGSQDERDVVAVVWKPGEDAVPHDRPVAAFSARRAAGFSGVDVNDEHWRIYTRQEPTMTIQVAQRSSVRRELTQEAATQTLWPIAVLLPLVWIAVALVVRRSLRQLNRARRGSAGHRRGSSAAAADGRRADGDRAFHPFDQHDDRAARDIDREGAQVHRRRRARTAHAAHRAATSGRQSRAAYRRRQSGALSGTAQGHCAQRQADRATAAARARRCAGERRAAVRAWICPKW